MAGSFEKLLDGLSGLGGGLLDLVPLIGVILALIVLNRVLGWQSRKNAGHSFRNQLVMAAALFIGLLVVVVALPVDASLRGQLLTLIGIIFSVTISLSSSTFLGNAMAGIMLRSVRNFRSGDFVEVGEHFGRVTERGLFHTEIQTPTRDLTTLPNLYLATTPVRVVRPSGTIVDATVSLGYDEPHAKIEPLLIGAATKAELQEPFVQVLDLGDFAVTYRVAGLLTETRRLLTFRSRLRVAMLDSLHAGGVEIVSPHFVNRRDYDPRREFVPPPVADPEPVAVDASPDVVFDKAEEAESLDGLRKELVSLQNQAVELKSEIKDAPDKGAKATLETRLAVVDSRISVLEASIVAAEEDAKVKDDED